MSRAFDALYNGDPVRAVCYAMRSATRAASIPYGTTEAVYRKRDAIATIDVVSLAIVLLFMDYKYLQSVLDNARDDIVRSCDL